MASSSSSICGKRRPSSQLTVSARSSSKRRRRLATSEVPDTSSSSSWGCRKLRSPLSACSSSKRRRRLASSSLWASLPGDLLPLIGWRLLADDCDLLDYVRFRAVCAHWRSSTVCPRGRGVVDPRFHPRRWMMLPEGHGLHPGHRKLRGYIRFFNLYTGPATLVRSNLHPLFKNHTILTTVDGLLLLQRHEDTAVRLLHPFTGDIAEFPPLVTLLKPDEHALLKKHRRTLLDMSAAASLSVSADGGAMTLMIVFDWQSRLAFATPGDEKWSVPSWSHSYGRLHEPLSFQGKLYMLGRPTPLPRRDCSGTPIFRIDPPPAPPGLDNDHRHRHDMPPPELIAKYPSGKTMRPLQLVECNSEIMLVDFGDPVFSRIVVYKLADLIMGKVAPLTSIGDDNVILAGEMSMSGRTLMSVSSRLLPNVDGNSVVAVNYKERYLGQYHLGSATWSPVVDKTIYRCVTGPRCLIHHVFTCCNRLTWKRGAISFLFVDRNTDSREVDRHRRLGI